MATLTGVGGAVTFPAGVSGPANANAFEWRLDTRGDVVDNSDFSGSGNGKAKLGLMYDGVGTVRLTATVGDHPSIFDMATVGRGGTAGFVLTTEPTKTLTFAGIITNSVLAVVKGDRVFYDVSFETDGEIVPSEDPP